jgi:hypothetical protein
MLAPNRLPEVRQHVTSMPPDESRWRSSYWLTAGRHSGILANVEAFRRSEAVPLSDSGRLSNATT